MAMLGISVMGQRMFYTQKSSLLKMICLYYFLEKKIVSSRILLEIRFSLFLKVKIVSSKHVLPLYD